MDIQKLAKLFVMVIVITMACNPKQTTTESSAVPGDKATYQTKNVIVLVIDGPRFSETWGDTSHRHIPLLANELSKEGVVYSQFYNDGPTYTNAGHTAITTGLYQEINNNGEELPKQSSMFQHWLKKYNQPDSAAWVIASKDKLEVLTDTRDSLWHGQFRPSSDCGVNGLTTGYRTDSVTFAHVLRTLTKSHPRLMLINLRDPDSYGHANKWEQYLMGIRNSDEYLYQLWKFLQNDPFYAETTTLFVTNDHGRHLDDVRNGFVDHGCNCEGCRHINLFAIGPDFKQGVVEQTKRGQIDIPATIAALLDFELPAGQGQVMTELFKKDEEPRRK